MMGQSRAVMAQLLREQMWFHRQKKLPQPPTMEDTLDPPGPCRAAGSSVLFERALNSEVCGQAYKAKTQLTLWSRRILTACY